MSLLSHVPYLPYAAAANSTSRTMLLVAVLLLVLVVVAVVAAIVLMSGRRRRMPPVMPPTAPPPVPGGYAPPADFDATMMQPGRAMPAWQLTATSGPDAGRVYTLGSRAQIGRAPGNEVHLNDTMASRAHALIEWRGNGYALSDLGSSNGTLLNGARLTQPAVLNAGDVITIGTSQLLLGAGQAPAPSGAAVRAAPPYAPPATAAPVPERGGCLSFTVLLYLIGWFVLFAIIGVAVYLYTKEPLGVAGVGLAALISLIFMVLSLSQSWHGQIVELRTERVYIPGDEDSGGDWEDQLFAYIQEPNRRKPRKMRAMPGWAVGDYLEKRRGETNIRVRSGSGVGR